MTTRRTGFWMRAMIVLLAAFGHFAHLPTATADEPKVGNSDPRQHPLSVDDRAKLRKQWDDDLADVSKKLDATPDSVSLLSKRGDVHFFRGEFAKSVRDYEPWSK